MDRRFHAVIRLSAVNVGVSLILTGFMLPCALSLENQQGMPHFYRQRDQQWFVV